MRLFILFTVFPVRLHGSGPTTGDPRSKRLRSGAWKTAQAGEISNAAWWEQFQDPVLARLVGQALESNKDLEIATAQRRRGPSPSTASRAPRSGRRSTPSRLGFAASA